MPNNIVAFVLAGGRGSRLHPLTTNRAKPAISFGGKYRVVDFVLSNLINSGIFSIYVLVQANSHSLLRHLRDGWQIGGLLHHQFIIPVPAQLRSAGDTGYKGTADAIYQNLNLIEDTEGLLVAIFGADHIYRMNIGHMIDQHARTSAEVTVAAYPVDAALAAEFGVIETLDDGSIVGFHEKSAAAPTIRGEPRRVYASMGNYIFSATTLLRELQADARSQDSHHDFGHDILPGLLSRVPMYAYDFQSNEVPGTGPDAEAYWRDVGTIDAYYDAQMDLCGVLPALNLYNRRWPIRTASYPDPGAKFTFDVRGRPGTAIGSVISGGCILSGGSVRGSIIGREVQIESEAFIEDSVVLDNCRVGRRARIRRAIVDENVIVPAETSIGYDREVDAQHHYITARGITVVTTSSLASLMAGCV